MSVRRSRKAKQGAAWRNFGPGATVSPLLPAQPRARAHSYERLDTSTPPPGWPADRYNVQEGDILHNDAGMHGRFTGFTSDGQMMLVDFRIFGEGGRSVRVSPDMMSYSALNNIGTSLPR